MSNLCTTENGLWKDHSGGIASALCESFDELMKVARLARESAYAPYSHFRVGSAVLMDGEISKGCNVENASYGGTICAERSAIFSAVSDGRRKLQIIAVTTDASKESAIENRSPCGFCRQVISEFAIPEALVLLDGGPSDASEFTGEILRFDDLLPYRFRLDQER